MTTEEMQMNSTGDLTIKEIVNFIIKDNEPAKMLNAIISMVLEHQNFMVADAENQLTYQENRREEIYGVINGYTRPTTAEVPRFEAPVFDRKRP